MQPEIIRTVARAQFIRRHFTNLSLSQLTWTYTQHNLVVEQMSAWKTLSDSERQEWLDHARVWLEEIQQTRPNIYNILIDGIVNMELAGDYEPI